MKSKISVFSGLERMDQVILIVTLFGDIAQLARAFDWQSRGQGFDSPYLHQKG